MKPVILFRSTLGTQNELLVAKQYFDVYQHRTEVPKGSLVIGRYSVLPYYDDLETDLNNLGSQLINTPKQHKWIADLWNWYDILQDETFKTWRRLEDVPDDAFPIVIKGETNSHKWLWDTHMFAATRNDAVAVRERLQEDTYLSGQWLYYRQYVPLKLIGYGFRGLRITHEFRIFVLDGVIVGKGYYWSNFAEDFEDIPEYDVPITVTNRIINKIGDRARFYVLDIAKTETGQWILVEVNDGQMAGLSMVDPEALYQNMRSSFPLTDT